MGFSEFLGNEATVRQLRLSIGSGRLPQAMILAGAAGAGKYTLALMVARAMNCTGAAELESRRQRRAAGLLWRVPELRSDRRRRSVERTI